MGLFDELPVSTLVVLRCLSQPCDPMLLTQRFFQHLFTPAHYNLSRSERGEPRLFLHYGDLADTSNLVDVLRRVKPDEIYNLAAQSHVQVKVRDIVFLVYSQATIVHLSE